MQDPSISEQLLMTTIRIECTYSGSRTGIGTGVFINLFKETNGDMFPVLVTNKHLIRDAVEGRLVLPFKIGSLGPELKGSYGLRIESFETPWVDHPDEKVIVI